MTKSSVEIPVNDLLKTSISDKLFRGCISIIESSHSLFIRQHSKNESIWQKKNPVKQIRVEVRPSIYFTQLKQKNNKDFLLYQYISVL